MRRESKSMWLRRIGPLGVAGLLVWPFAGTAAEAAAGEGKSEHVDLYSAEHQSRLDVANSVEADRVNALMLGRTAEEKLVIEKALQLAADGKPEEARELFSRVAKTQAELDAFIKAGVGRASEGKGVEVANANQVFAAREAAAARLAVEQKSVMEMVGQGRYKEAEKAYKALIVKLVPNAEEAQIVQNFVDQCNFAGACESVKDLSSVKGEWNQAKLKEVLKEYEALYRVWSASLMKEAQAKAKEKEYGEAIAIAQRAQKLDIDQAYIKSFLEECQKSAGGAVYRAETSLDTLASDYEANKKAIDHTMREAKIFFRNKQYEAATSRLERVLLLDAFNLEAIDMLAQCYNRLYESGIERSTTSVMRAEALNVWEWDEAIDKVEADNSTAKEAVVHNAGKSTLYNKLERVIFPSVSLKDYTLVNVITYLNDKSRAYDPEHEGVTVIDNLSAQDKQRQITVEFGKISLMDIIRYLSLETGLSYSLRGDKVIFGNVDSMSTEFFPVRGDIIAEIIDSQLVKQSESGMSGAEGEGGGSMGGGSSSKGSSKGSKGSKGGDDLGGGMGAMGGGMGGDDLGGGMGGGMGGGAGISLGGNTRGGASVQLGANEEGADAMASMNEARSSTAAETSRNSAALKAYFADRWINFDNGANILYSPRGERLVVKNTPENLRRMATLLKQLDALEQPMILVEVKLIELDDTNLESLGFEWAFSASKTDGLKTDWAFGTTDPTRHGDGTNKYRVLNNLKILPNFGEKIFGSDVNVDMSLSINAVAHNQRSEILSSPRILTQSGMKEPAKIQMTEKQYFVTEWDKPDVESNGFSISVETSAPEWDEERDIGVTFTVKPTVDSDNYTITLEDIHPIFLEFLGNRNKKVDIEVGQIIDGKQVPTKTWTYNMEMPMFANREIISSITLYDGETVLLGGMADNTSSMRDDKWPLLGDIPLLGRFFQDKATDVTNHSMLMFITARLVNANGVPLRSVRDRGLVDFNR